MLLPLVLTGCAQYARLEQVEIGMTLDNFRTLPTPIYYRGTSENTVQYGARLIVPSGQSLSQRSILPYIFTFTDNKLTEITFDEEEQKRRERRGEFRFGYGFGYHRYHYYHP
jgi:hypothetical protein